MKLFYFWLMFLTCSAMLTGVATFKSAHGMGDWSDAALYGIWGVIAGSMLAGQARRLR